jgi:hypothetical protein
LAFDCAGDDELGEEIFQEEEHEHGDNEDSGVAPAAEHIPTTSTTIKNRPSPTLQQQTKIKEKMLLRGGSFMARTSPAS